jgi:hypothetical protein
MMMMMMIIIIIINNLLAVWKKKETEAPRKQEDMNERNMRQNKKNEFCLVTAVQISNFFIISGCYGVTCFDLSLSSSGPLSVYILKQVTYKLV